MSFPVEEQFILAAEQVLGRLLPASLRKRLRVANGGDVEVGGDTWTLFPVWDPTDRRRMVRTANHIIRETEQARGWRSFPQRAIAVGANGSGDLLILPEGSDEIVLWDHE